MEKATNSIQKVIERPEYEFLKTNPHLGKNIMFLTYGGSYAYGTNIEGSDIDVRGVAANTEAELFGLSNFEQAIDNGTDTTVYGFRKYLSLIMACNPNVIEMLGCRPEDYVLVSPAGRLLLENKSLFLSRKAIYSFGGYAQAQLRRLQIAVARHRVTPQQKGDFILTTCDSAMRVKEDEHGIPHGLFKLKLTGYKENGDPIISVFADKGFSTFETDGIPLAEMKGFLGELAGIVKSYDSLGRRNDRAKEKSDRQLNKHAMHLVRLYLMALDILEKGEINTYRAADREYLLNIRNGLYMLPDGTYSDEFFQMVSEYDKRLKYAGANSPLPAKPDYAKVEELAIEINRLNMNIGA